MRRELVLVASILAVLLLMVLANEAGRAEAVAGVDCDAHLRAGDEALASSERHSSWASVTAYAALAQAHYQRYDLCRRYGR